MTSVLWPEHVTSKIIVLDFDKTITNRHTRGAVFQPSGLDTDELVKNFADIEFFRKIVPIITKQAVLCIATFADDEEEALLSGKDLVRRYLDVAFDGKSAEYIPDANIEAWNPENRSMDMKIVGKNIHLENLKRRVGRGTKKAQIVLFDDSERNCLLARKIGYSAHFVQAAASGEDGMAVAGDTGFCEKAWHQFLASDQCQAKDVGCVIA